MAYIGKSPTGSGVRQRYVYTATGGETSLSGADDNSKTLKFTDGEYVDVHLNGIQLVQGTDYGVGTANTIDGLTALSSGNVVEITVYDVYNVAKINSEAMRNRYYYTATGGETSLTTTQISGLSFPANAEIEVRLNGIALVQGTDFNTTTVNTVGGLAALAANDVVEIVYYESFQLADVVSKAAGGTYNGDVTFNGNINAGTIKDATGTNTGLTIDSSGRVLLPQVPCASVGLTTANTQDTTNPYTYNSGRIIFDEVYENQGSVYNTSTGHFTAPVDGIYEISFSFLQDDDASASAFDLRIRKNDVNLSGGYNAFSTNNSDYAQIAFSRLISLSANDTLSLRLHTGAIFIAPANNYNIVNFRLVG